MKTPTTLAARIVAAREAAGMTGAELAKQAGLTESQVSHYQRGTEPRRENLRKIAKVLGTTVAELIGE